MGRRVRKLLLYHGLSALAVDLTAVPYGVNQQYLLSIEHLIDHAKVSDPQLVEPSKVAAQCLRFHAAEVRCQPVEALDDAPCFGPVDPRQVAGRGIQKTSPEPHS